MGFYRLMENASFPEISFLLQLGEEILAMLCSDDSNRNLLILPALILNV